MVGIAQRDIARIPTSYGQLIESDRIHLGHITWTIRKVTRTEGYTLVSCITDDGRRNAWGQKDDQPVTRSSRDTSAVSL